MKNVMVGSDMSAEEGFELLRIEDKIEQIMSGNNVPHDRNLKILCMIRYYKMRWECKAFGCGAFAGCVISSLTIVVYNAMIP